jgi:NAD(P) transhydrogenase subunit alpha
MIAAMKGGSVIIDLASSTGGNTELTKDNETIKAGNVTIIGNSNLASSVPADASKLYGKNIFNFLGLLINDKGVLDINLKDDIIKGACVTPSGKTSSPVTLKLV